VKLYLGVTKNEGRDGGGTLDSIEKAMKIYLVAPPKGGLESIMGTPSMKTYLVASSTISNATPDYMAKVARPSHMRILLSYFYFRDKDLDDVVDVFGGIPVEIFADSGAYSAATSGSTIKAEEYIEWVRRWQHRITVCAAPDVIGDAAATERDTNLMLKANLKTTVLPVYHVGEPWEYLQKWSAEHDYIALGGMVPYSMNPKFLRAWCAKAFKVMRPGTKVHGFGMTSWDKMIEFPWHSVDSSSWTSAVRFGQIQLFDSKRGTMVDVTMRDPKELLRHQRLLAEYGLSGREALSGGKDRSQDSIVRACIMSWQAAEAWLAERRK
jgi:hypothetical protein